MSMARAIMLTSQSATAVGDQLADLVEGHLQVVVALPLLHVLLHIGGDTCLRAGTEVVLLAEADAGGPLDDSGGGAKEGPVSTSYSVLLK